MLRNFIAFTKILAFLLWTFTVVPLQLIVLLCTQSHKRYFIPWIWHNGVCFIFRLHVSVSGKIEKAPSTLYISNHISWLDIPVIGSILKASFVAKREVASWPFFGFLSKLQQTAFIDRSPKAALREKNSLKNQLESGKSLILFPEGTSSNGQEVLPFKSSLFEIAKTEEPIKIQPFSISIKSLNNIKPSSQKEFDLYAWYADMELVPHLWSFAKSKGAHIHLDFMDSIKTNGHIERKEISERASTMIKNSFKNHQK